MDSQLMHSTIRPRKQLRPADAASCAVASQHQDWLLDEALQETFPASDPISPAQTLDRQATPVGIDWACSPHITEDGVGMPTR